MLVRVYKGTPGNYDLNYPCSVAMQAVAMSTLATCSLFSEFWGPIYKTS